MDNELKARLNAINGVIGLAVFTVISIKAWLVLGLGREELIASVTEPHVGPTLLLLGVVAMAAWLVFGKGGAAIGLAPGVPVSVWTPMAALVALAPLVPINGISVPQAVFCWLVSALA